MCVCAMDCLVNYILGSGLHSQGAGKTKAEPLRSLLKLQQISNHPTELQGGHYVPHFCETVVFQYAL